jgi:hypothetical protein
MGTHKGATVQVEAFVIILKVCVNVLKVSLEIDAKRFLYWAEYNEK